ncbi:MAG: TetR/AcrR family transcriptional regulator [Gammaproteobacteria bacterium]
MTTATAATTREPSPRIRRRQKRTRQAILQAAIDKFAVHGIAGVSIEEIIDAADVSRGTFYKHFKSKEDVLTQILVPMMSWYGKKLEAIDAEDPQQILDQIFDVYIQIWREAPGAFSLASQESRKYFHLLEESHLPVMTNMRRLFEIIEKHGILRAGTADYAVALLARSAVVVLRVFDQDPDWEQLFRATMRGFLLDTNAELTIGDSR